MVFDGRYKLVKFQGYRPILHDLEADPQEYHDLGVSPEAGPTLDKLYEYLKGWGLRMSQRVTMSEADIDRKKGEPQREGILVGVHREADLEAKFTEHYEGPARQIHLGLPEE